MNPNWTRWTHASISKYFQEYFQTHALVHFQVEGQDRIPREAYPRIELRWDGPTAEQKTVTKWRLDIEINVLIGSILTTTDAHAHKKVVGIAQAAFTNILPIYRYGEDVGDTQDLLGCFQMKEGIVTSYFGKLEVDIMIEQSTIEAHYKMHLP